VKGSEKPIEREDWTKASHQAFDMRGVNRFSYVDTSRNSSLSLSNDGTPSRNSSTSIPGTLNSSESTPNIPTPESMRQFDPDKFFGDMNLANTGIDVTMNMGGIGDDGGVEFFTDMLGVNLNGN
jgi:hypothetical protein